MGKCHNSRTDPFTDPFTFTITQSLRDFPNSEILSYFLGIPFTAISLK